MGSWIAVSIATVAGLAAQHTPGHVETDCGPAHYPVRMQETDGHWSAARGGGQADADLRVTALMLLALLGDGSTLRTGLYRDSLKRGVRWLRQQQDPKGRFALRGDPDWLLDHAIATYALVEAVRMSRTMFLAPDVRRAVTALDQHLQKQRPVAGVEVRLWGEMIVRSVRVAEAALLQQQAAEDSHLATDLGSDLLARSLSALPPAVPVSAREQAAQFLRDALAARLEAVAPAEWVEAPLQDPLASFYACAGVYLRGGPEFRRVSKRLTQTLVGTQQKDGEHRDSWDPAGEFGQRNGRCGSTAAALLLMEIYYRYSRLQLWD